MAARQMVSRVPVFLAALDNTVKLVLMVSICNYLSKQTINNT
jgi:hypothetical protein